MVPIFLWCSWMQFNGEENNLNRGFKRNIFCCVLMHNFWWFPKLLILTNCLRRSWNNFFLAYFQDDVFYSIPYLGLKQATLSQQQLFVINLACFLNFNPKNLAKFGIFYPKWLLMLKIVLFYLGWCYQSKKRCKTFIQLN